MKEVKVLIPSDKLEIVKELEDKLGLVFYITIFEDRATITSVVENQHTSTLLEELKGVGVGTVFGSIIVSPVAIQITSESKDLPLKGRGISIDEMISSTKGLALLNPTFIGLIILAGALASFGLVYDNVIIIIASMIIAPLLGPIALAVISSMTPQNIYSRRSLLAEITGLTLIILFGLFVGLSFYYANPTLITDNISNPSSQIAIRIEPRIGDIVFAIASGLAAGIFIMRGESTAIVGVAVAASLCPPAANVGVLIGARLFTEALGSLILLVLNVIAIYAACALIFWTTQSLVRGGTVTIRQFKRISRKYMIQIIMTLVILITIILLIVFYRDIFL
ncbi:MAG: TIGR00341 family protein [Candidatus Heimdallarchaeota archaeon]|nr:TIGR00341 family protein [Candidatus Heimdallarchaeota archaeon]MCK4954447.1 TIGR00341 family protein [Candidatus Heimdallarchaeota archaeon]